METYRTNEAFKEYVDRVCKQHNITVEEALEWYIVKEVEKMYKEREK